MIQLSNLIAHLENYTLCIELMDLFRPKTLS